MDEKPSSDKRSGSKNQRPQNSQTSKSDTANRSNAERQIKIVRPDRTNNGNSTAANSTKQTNQQDRFSRPSLSQHGARRYATDRPTNNGQRRYSENQSNKPQFQSSPKVNINRNPRLNDDRPMVTKSPPPAPNRQETNRPTQTNNQSSNRSQLNRRRFTAPNGSNKPSDNRDQPAVLATGNRKLRIIPLGGAGEVGAKNMTVFEYGNDILIVDCGIAFPDKDQLGIDAIIADTTYLEERKNNIRGMVFTHGHEDHIGGTPYIWPKLNCAMYATPLTCGLIKHKLDEAGIQNAPLTVIEAGDRLNFGQISVEAVRLTHSIPDVLGLAIRCPAGLFFYATDWRMEHTPALGKPADWTRVSQLAGEGITALFSDSTNVDRPGYSPSEKMIGEAFDRILSDAKGRVIIAQFSSQLNRIQQVINSAKKFGRVIAISGRSMETYTNIAMSLGYLKIPEGMVIDLKKVNTYEPNRVVILSTGSQGEEFSSLVRISEGEHRHIKLDKTDTVVISASTVPGNEASVDKLIDNLYREGARVMHSKLMTDIHVSGHPSRDELKLMFALTQPRFFIPIHGDYHRMCEHGNVAVEMGVDERNVILMENGQVVEFDARGGKMTNERLQLNDVYIDGKGIGDVGPVVIRDRQTLGNEGMVTVFMVVKEKTGEMVTSPDIITRGFIYIREAEDLMRRLREEIKKIYADVSKESGTNWDEVKQSMRDKIGKFLEDSTGREPMVIPVITTI